MSLYNVWLGGIPGVESVPYLKALEVYKYWLNLGYDDILIEEVKQ